MKNLLIVFVFILSFPIHSISYDAGNYYFCDNKTFKTAFDYDFTFQQRNGTVSNPNHYDPKQPSREYIMFSMSSYPIPNWYIPIVEETETEIYLQGTFAGYYTDSKKNEYFTFVLNKNDVSFKGTVINYKNEIKKVESKCRKNRY